MNWQPGDRVRVKQPDGSYHAGVIHSKVQSATSTNMWYVTYSGSRPGYYPNPIIHTESEIEHLQ
jgi:hypothetical protein